MNAWSDIEVELIVADYFEMLSIELSGKNYSKAEHRRNLLPLLTNRSEGSIEFKHQNISAVLINLGHPYIKGYLPRFNYQKVLEDKVVDYLTGHLNIEDQFKKFAETTIDKPTVSKEFDKLIVQPPVSTGVVKEPVAAYTRSPIKTNYLEQEQRNRSLGLLGEEFILEYEKWQLRHAGKESLADQVHWISKEEGDGAGFDILSRNENGTDKYIEVKTTKLGKETPFYFSRNELLFSQNKSSSYHLYRLFNFNQKAKMFVKMGGLDSICTSIPVSYQGRF
ncbi:protein NO VEIN domain-containing protein [Halocola ammonii]